MDNDGESTIGATPGWVRRNPEEHELDELYEYVAQEVGFITAVLDSDKMDSASPIGHWEWEEYQMQHLEHGGWWAGNKCRQSGLSTSFSAKAFARGILTERNYNAIFVSYKREEAINKINYVRMFLEALPPRFRKEIIRDPMQLIEWENPNGTRAKIMSHAQRPIRGINGDVFLDELAFYQFADEIYASALPAVAMVRGTIDVTSTPFGAGDKFYEIITNRQKYPEFRRDMIYWWQCTRYLKDPSIEFLVRAIKEAPKMSVEERVNVFGNQQLVSQFKNADDIETFRQEFEGYFVDAQAAFFTRDLILNSMYPEVAPISDYQVTEADFTDMTPEEALKDLNWPLVSRYPEVGFQRYHKLEDLYEAVRNGDITPNLMGGADIGATRHSSEFFVIEEIILKNGQTLQVERFRKSEDEWDPTDQQNYYDAVLTDGYVKRIHADATGIGYQLCKYLQDKWGEDTFKGVHLGGNTKTLEKMFVNLRARMENDVLALAHDRVTVEDIYSIERVLTKTKQVTFHADEKKRHHADRAYAIALASLAGTEYGKSPSTRSYTERDAKRMKEMMQQRTGLPDEKTVTSNFKSLMQRLSKREQRGFMKAAHPGKFIHNHDE